MGHRTNIVPSSDMAAAIVFSVKPELILLDIDSPVYCGIDFHELLRNNRRGRWIPVLYLSSTCTWVQRESAETNGAAAMLPKDSDPERIALVVQKHLDKLNSDTSMVTVA
jgi:CheY-like chemotaxis protein